MYEVWAVGTGLKSHLQAVVSVRFLSEPGIYQQEHQTLGQTSQVRDGSLEQLDEH